MKTLEILSPLRLSWVAVATAVFLACSPGMEVGGSEIPEGEEGPLAERPSEVDKYFGTLAERGLFNGVVLIATDREVVLRRSYTIPEAPDGLQAHPEDQFLLASVSKLLLKYVAYAMAEEGRLALSDPVSSWIGGLPDGDSITIEQLIVHSSGLPRELDGIDELTRISPQEFLRRAAAEPLEFAPGSDTLYSNVGYQLLAEMLSAASDEGYDALFERYLTGPAGMGDTAEYLSLPPQRLAVGFELSDGSIEPGDHVELERFRYLRLYSTVDDLYSFALALFDPAITGAPVLEGMLAGGDVVRHAGAMEGYRAYFQATSGAGSVFTFLSNFEDIPFVRITEDVPKILAGEPVEVPSKPNRTAIAIEAEVLEMYVGRYRLDVDPDQVFEIRVDGEQLEVVDNEGESTLLFAETATQFFDDPASSESLEFSLDESTGHYEMSLIIQGGMRLQTTRVD